ncbi:MAG: tetratricopeptide repeat protein [Chitinivibrionia bacterium]|nr:tetratricopeptide repeat protein [Chitinivibrionia bacterium]
MDQASYVRLAKEWKEYIEKNGESADALVNLGMAYRYTDELEAAVNAGKRAVDLEPDNPKALAFLGAMLSVYLGDDDGAVEPLERCRRIAPGYEWGLTTLATVYLRRGEWSKSEEVFKAIFEQRIIPQPLQDFAYNMLIGLPEGAVLITGGDNDTFAPLSLQTGMKLREDVIVLNRSLLNLPSYAKAVFVRHPSIKPDFDIDNHVVTVTPDGKAALLASKLIERMMAENKAPLFFASSANYESYGFKPEARVEGINLRLTGKGLSAEESSRLFFYTYRLDSATDWNYAWSLTPTVAEAMSNYVTAMFNVAQEKELGKETRRRLLEKALEIADFHDFERMAIYIRKALKSK